MIHLIIAAIAAVAGAGAGALVVTFWDDIRRILREWLADHNLQQSALSSAVVILDRLAVGVRRKLRVRAPQHGTRVISEEHISLDQVDDPRLRALLETKGYAEADILQQR